MKPLHLIPIPIIAIAIGWMRQPELDHLRAENVRLQPPVAALKFRSERRSSERLPLSGAKREEVIGMARELQRMRDGEISFQPSSLELRRKFCGELAAMDRSQVTSLIEASSSGLDQAGRAKMIDIFAYAFMEIDPKEALLLVAEIPEYASRDQTLMSAILQCVPADPALAVRTFSQLEAAGRMVSYAEVVRPSICAARARLEPEALVSDLLSEAGATWMQDTKGIPFRIGQELRTPEEHRAFLAALRVEATGRGDSPALDELRKGYLGYLVPRLGGWPTEEALATVEAEFTTAEKTTLANLLDGEADEPGRWADWTAKLEPPASIEHPIGQFIQGWMGLDRVGARTWLDGQPEGPVRDAAVMSYAMQLSKTDTPEAADAAMLLPAGEERSRAFAVIRNVWKRKDPAAWSAFASGRGLKE